LRRRRRRLRREADVVFTMLMDDPALKEVLYKGKVLESLGKGAIHVSLSTLSVALSKELTEEHARRGQHFVAGPVFGRRISRRRGSFGWCWVEQRSRWNAFVRWWRNSAAGSRWSGRIRGARMR